MGGFARSPKTPEPRPTAALSRSTVRSENGSRRTCSRSGHPGHGGTRRGRSADGAPCKVAGDTGDVGPRKAPLGARANRRWLLPWRLSLTRRRTPTSRSAVPLHTSTSTEENGSRWPAQRLGRRLVIWSLEEPWRRGARSRARPSGAVLRSLVSTPYVVFPRAPVGASYFSCVRMKA